MDTRLQSLARHASTGAAIVLRTAVEVAKPPVKAVVSMVGRHPEAVVGGLAGYAVGKQLDRVWGIRLITGRKAKYVLAFLGSLYGYQMGLQRRQLDLREDLLAKDPGSRC